MPDPRSSAPPYKAVILDLDGVITQTAHLHAQAWKRMFDEYVQQRTEGEGDHAPFSIDSDYPEYVDGKPRYDGVQSFLASRGIELPWGSPDDRPDEETVCGLGNRKNAHFHELLQERGVETYADAVEQARRWRRQGLKTAVITSSRNGRTLLEVAGLEDLFDARLDGIDAAELGLAGKPAPDVFLEAARQLSVTPQEAIVVEDAIAGVQAARAGGFAFVVGVTRNGDDDALREHGADIVVADLREIAALSPTRETPQGAPTPALHHIEHILERLDDRRLALFLDYDGTLTPIVRRPEEALLSDEMRELLRALAQRATVAIVSGRDLADVRDKVGLENLYYAGSHGFDVAGPGDVRMQQEEARTSLPSLDDVEGQLSERLEDIEGARVERKRFAIAVHYREAASEDVGRIEDVVDDVVRTQEKLRKKGGKKIFELQPDVEWDKGHAVRWLLEELALTGQEVVPLYLGDDTTDEDAFGALSADGIGIRVGMPDEPTEAAHYLEDTEEVKRFFEILLEHLEEVRDG